MSVCFGGSGSDSRQRGSVMAGYWIRLQPELPQYTQYNVPLCSPAACPAHICSWGPSCLEDHNHDKNTPTKITHRATEVHTYTGPAGKTEPTHLATRGETNMKLDKVGKQKARGAQTLSLYFLSSRTSRSIGPSYHKRSQMAATLWCKRRPITLLSLRQETGLPGT